MNTDLFYKYIGFGDDGRTVRTEFLRNEQFRFTQPDDLNDPFEARPIVRVAEYSLEDITEGRRRAMEEGFPVDTSDGMIKALVLDPLPRGRIGPPEFPGVVLARPDLRPEPFESLNEMDRFEAHHAAGQFIKTVNETYRIFSLTTSSDNLVMWTHYAACHSGLVVGFDKQHDYFNRGFIALRPVDYIERRISITSNFGWIRIAGQRFDFKEGVPHLISVFLRKHPDWSYEKEWRMIKRLDQCDARSPTNAKVHLFRIPNSAVKTVILGAKMSDAEVNRITGIISADSRWAHVRIFRAELSSQNFGLRFLRLP